jgi:diaminohydroxyphosphoribosylaminopyrimidine deaminase/5-amino-6-(5-phosphoribosylamino)uracil reductase
MNEHEIYMRRCFQLAQLGEGRAAPNPIVGAVLVHENRIIGEGFHAYYGGPHAEVNCVASVSAKNQLLIPESTLYVSLEPCNHHGKTPPCVDLILKHHINHVVVSVVDPFEHVKGSGIQRLRDHGVEVETGVLSEEGKKLIYPFYIHHSLKRPCIILKWAQTANRKMSGEEQERLIITNSTTNLWMHKLRSRIDAIVVGSETALRDNPSLTNRMWPGKSPAKVLMDSTLKVSDNNAIYHGETSLYVFNQIREESNPPVNFVQMENLRDLKSVVTKWYELGFQTVMIEGGPTLLQSFIDADLYDEIIVLENTALRVDHGKDAPSMPQLKATEVFHLDDDKISIYHHESSVTCCI